MWHWRKDSLAILFFLFLPLLFFPELFFQTKTLYRGDLTWIHYPLRTLVAKLWFLGQIPLWNPYVMGGMPLLAEAQVGVINPFYLLYLLPLPLYRIFTLFITVHFVLAATNSYILTRLLGLSRSAALIAGLSFGFGGVLMAQVTNLNIMIGAAWLPLVFASLVWALNQPQPGLILFAGLPLALQILTSHPQIPFLTLLLLLFYLVFQTIASLKIAGSRKPIAGSKRFSFALPCQRLCLTPFKTPPGQPLGQLWLRFSWLVGSGLLLAAPQLLPTLEMQTYSIRAGGVDSEQLIYFSMPPVQWLSLFFPNVFGTSVTGYHGVAGNFEEMNIYIGLLPLVLALLSGFMFRTRPMVQFLWLALGVSVVLSAGGYLPFLVWLQYVPGFNLFRAPTRWLLIANFCLAILAAYGWENILTQRPKRSMVYGLSGVWLLLLLSLLVIYWWHDFLFQWADSLPRNQLVKALRELFRRGLFETPREYGSRLILGPLAWWTTPAVALITRWGVAVALMSSYAYQRLTRSAFITATIALVTIDLALSGGTAVNRFTEATHWQQLSGVTQYLLDHEAAHLARFYSVASSEETEVVVALKHYYPSLYGLSGSGGHSPVRLRRYDRFMEQAHPLLRLDLTATRFVINKGRLTADAESVMHVVAQDGEWYLYEYPDALPRAFVVQQAIAVNDDVAALEYLRNGAFDPLQQVILETDQPLPVIKPVATPHAEVTITQDKPMRVEIQADLDQAGFLVLSDTAYPGWIAYVDGQPTPIMTAYYRTRAIYVEPGSHTIQFVYGPWSFYGGLALAVGLVIGQISYLLYRFGSTHFKHI